MSSSSIDEYIINKQQECKLLYYNNIQHIPAIIAQLVAYCNTALTYSHDHKTKLDFILDYLHDVDVLVDVCSDDVMTKLTQAFMSTIELTRDQVDSMHVSSVNDMTTNDRNMYNGSIICKRKSIEWSYTPTTTEAVIDYITSDSYINQLVIETICTCNLNRVVCIPCDSFYFTVVNGSANSDLVDTGLADTNPDNCDDVTDGNSTTPHDLYLYCITTTSYKILHSISSITTHGDLKRVTLVNNFSFIINSFGIVYFDHDLINTNSLLGILNQPSYTASEFVQVLHQRLVEPATIASIESVLFYLFQSKSKQNIQVQYPSQ
ncbi:Hypothetical protein MVR_LOCUS107 [uncultured virus]|nr:Hypothetical protein MVR_LOCUS107 [uncultured virus]